MPNHPPPPPGHIHPWYADKPWIHDWVTGKPPYCSTDHRLKVPIMHRPNLSYESSSPDLHTITMDRHKAAGVAPYVGTPFMYVWYVGVDTLGRQVCSEAAIVHTNMFPDDFDPYDVPLIE